MPFHVVPGHQPHHTLRGVTFSAGSGASRPRVAVAVAPLPQPTAGPTGIPPRPPSGGQLEKPRSSRGSIFPLARFKFMLSGLVAYIRR